MVAPAAPRTSDGDFDGDGKTDITVYRPSSGTWFTLNSKTSTFSSVAFGLSTDVPVPGDYNADGTVDAADYTIWRDSFGQTGVNLAADADNSGTVFSIAKN